MILAVDTSTAWTSVAIVADGTIVAEAGHRDARRHAEVLAPMLRDVLASASVDRRDVTAIACGVGPGPYTGLRVGIASAIAFGAAWARPVYGVCSLDAIAAATVESMDGRDFCVATDARRSEVYWAHYSGGAERIAGPLVSRPGDIDERLRSVPWVGHGALAHIEQFGNVVAVEADDSPLLYPQAVWIGRRAEVLLAAGVAIGSVGVPLSAHGEDGAATSDALRGRDLLAPQPLYLRRPDAIEASRP